MTLLEAALEVKKALRNEVKMLEAQVVFSSLLFAEGQNTARESRMLAVNSWLQRW